MAEKIFVNTGQIDKEEEVKDISAEVNDLITAVTDLEVCDASTNEYAISLLAGIAGVRKKAETQRKAFTEPLNRSLKEINSFFKNFLAPAEKADGTLRVKVLLFRREEEERTRKQAAELQKKLESEAGEGTTPAPVVAQTPPTTVQARGGSATVKKTWDFALYDFDLIPKEYLAVDTKAISQAIKAGIREIPGVNIFQKESLAVNTR